MTTVAISYPQERSVFRCVLSQTTANFAAESRKRYENHRYWLEEKERILKLKREKEKKTQEDDAQKRLLLEEVLEFKEEKNKLEVKKWREQKNREQVMKKNERLAMELLNEKSQKFCDTQCQQIFNNWVRLKLQHKKEERDQLNQLLNKEKQKKELRKALANLCYNQWKEHAKCREIVIPKNGYQIFGPKPQPVVLEEWQFPQETKSLCTLNKNLRNQFSISSFRSEQLLTSKDSATSDLTQLKLEKSSWSLVPWGQKKVTPTTRNSRTSNGTDRSALSNGMKQPLKKKPPFR